MDKTEYLMVINPLQIEFFLNDNKEYEEFKVLNHCDKTYKFKVCYDKNRYSVAPSEFKIDGKTKVICKIKALKKVLSRSGETDQIFIQMFDEGASQPLSVRILDIKVSPGERPTEQSSSIETNVAGSINEPTATATREDSNKKKTLCLIFLGLLLLAFLPITEVDTQSIIPEFLHISVAFRLICVFLMGVLANEFYHLVE